MDQVVEGITLGIFMSVDQKKQEQIISTFSKPIFDSKTYAIPPYPMEAPDSANFLCLKAQNSNTLINK